MPATIHRPALHIIFLVLRRLVSDFSDWGMGGLLAAAGRRMGDSARECDRADAGVALLLSRRPERFVGPGWRREGVDSGCDSRPAIHDPYFDGGVHPGGPVARFILGVGAGLDREAGAAD